MIEVGTSATIDGGVAFVCTVLTNVQTTPQRVCVESRLSGPTWSPRCGEMDAPEWSGDRWKGIVEAGRTRGIGFATPVDPDDDLQEPVRIVSVERAEHHDESDRPDEVLASLDEWSPTADVVSRQV